MNSSIASTDIPASLLIENATILTLDPERPVISPGHLLIRKDIILAIEQQEADLSRYKVERRIDGSGKLVMPGLVDTHLHERPIRGVGDGLDVLEWHSRYVDEVAARMTADDARLGALLSYAELVRSGTTSVLVMCVHPEAEAEAASEFGIRARLVPHIETDPELDQYAPLPAQVNAQLRDDRVQLWFGMELPAYHSDQALHRTAKAALEQGLGIHTHFSEFRRDDIAQLQRAQLLGPHVSLAHCVWITDEDISVLADTKTNVVHNPKSNLRFGNGIAPISEVIKAGVNVSLGTDGVMSTHRLDMFEELRMAALLHRGQHRDPEAITDFQAISMATTHGARTLGLEGQIARLEPGMKADMLLLNTRHPSMTPFLHNEQFSNVVTLAAFCASADVVETVIIDGRIILDEGRLTSVDEKALLERVLQRAPQLLG